MHTLSIIIIAIGLSVDSFAVSVTSGLNLPLIRFKEAVKIAFLLALFQAAMPLIGFGIEASLKRFVEPIDHWIAFGLLLLIGGKMILENLKPHEEKKIINPLVFRVALLLAIATSIDALAVGFSLALLMENIIPAIGLIFTVTFLASMIGILIGKKTGPHLTQFAEILGGLILIGIGFKVLIEHLMASAVI